MIHDPSPFPSQVQSSGSFLPPPLASHSYRSTPHHRTRLAALAALAALAEVVDPLDASTVKHIRARAHFGLGSPLITSRTLHYNPWIPSITLRVYGVLAVTRLPPSLSLSLSLSLTPVFFLFSLSDFLITIHTLFFNS